VSIVRLNQKDQRLEIKNFEVANPIAFTYFDSLPQDQRDEAFTRAFYIGVLALKEDRLSSFLSKTTNELGTELESLKMIFDMKQELFFKTAVKGFAAEADIAEFLTTFCKSKKFKDNVYLTGNSAGEIARNKTGDIAIDIENDENLRIVIECKFDKSIKLGPIESKDVFGRKSDTVWSQLLESNANRSGKVSIIVLDTALVDRSIQNVVEKVGFIPSIGFVAIIDSQAGDYSSLAIAYTLARNIVVNSADKVIDQKFLCLMVQRILKDLDDLMGMEEMIDAAIKNLNGLRQTLAKGQASMSFSLEYLTKFAEEGEISKEDMFDFYMGGDVKDRVKSIEETYFKK